MLKRRLWMNVVGSVVVAVSSMGASCYKQPDLICQPDPLILGVSCYGQNGGGSGNQLSLNDLLVRHPLIINGQTVTQPWVITLGGDGRIDIDFNSLVGDLGLQGPYRIDLKMGSAVICSCDCLRLQCTLNAGGSFTITLTWKDGSFTWGPIVINFPGNPNPNPNPGQVTGSCCAPTGYCWLASETQCAAVGGNLTPGGVCGNFPCAPLGPCTTGNGSCQMTTQAGCPAGSTWTGGGNCNPIPPTTGSCTLPDGQCELSTAQTCNGGTFVPGGVCPPKAACCLGGCLTVNQNYCASLGGTWMGGAACTGNTCSTPAPTGSCCIGNGASCLSGVTQAVCNANGGVLTINGSCANCQQPLGPFNISMLAPASGSTHHVGNPVTATVQVDGGVGPFKYRFRWPDSAESPPVGSAPNISSNRTMSATHSFQFPISPGDDDGYGVITIEVTDNHTGETRTAQVLIEVRP